MWTDEPKCLWLVGWTDGRTDVHQMFRNSPHTEICLSLPNGVHAARSMTGDAWDYEMPTRTGILFTSS